MNYFTVQTRINARLAGTVAVLSTFLLALVLAVPGYAARHDPDSRGGDASVILPLMATPADTLEPNDKPSEASLLVWGTGVTPDEALSGVATISSGLDLDFYAIRLSLGDSLLATVTAPDGAASPLDPSLSIMDSAGTVLAGDLLTPGTVSVAAPCTGTYLLAVSDRSLLDGAPFTGTPREYELRLNRLLRRGDTDGSGLLDYRDAFVVFMLASGLLDPSLAGPRVLAAADLDGDGAVVGDMDDFNLLMRRIDFIPSRDTGSGGKRKAGSGQTLLALAAGSDGSLREILAAMSEAKKDSVLALLARFTGHPAKIPAASIVTLAAASPNPFNPSTTISFSVQIETALTLTVHDIRGRLVRTLASGKFPAGNHRVHWNGKDNHGRVLASGVYFSRLAGGGTTVSRKLVLLK